MVRLLQAARRSVRARIILHFAVILILFFASRALSDWIDDEERERIEALQLEYTLLIEEFLNAYQHMTEAAVIIGRRLHGERMGDVHTALEPLRREVRESLADLRSQVETAAMRSVLLSAEQSYDEVTAATDRMLSLIEDDDGGVHLTSAEADTAVVDLWEESASFSRTLNELAARGLSELRLDIVDATEDLQTLYTVNRVVHFSVIALAILLAVRLGRSITVPIDALTAGVEEFSRGNFGPIGLDRPDEFGSLAACFDEMGEEISRTLAESKQAGELALMVGATLDMDEIAERLLEVARQFTRARVLVLVMENVSGDGWTRYTLPESGAIQRDEMATFETGAVADPERAGMSLISIPIIAQQRVIGTLEMRGHESSAAIRRQANVISSLLVSVSTTLRNAQLFAQVSRERELAADRALELEKAHGELEQSQRFKSRFLASLGHQLRTPLSAVIGCADLLGGGVLGEVNERQREALQTILRCGHTLHLAFDRILNYSRLEGGEVDMLWGEFDVAGTIRDAAGRVAACLQDQRFDVQVDLDPEAVRWSSDPVKVRFILQHLLEHLALWAEAQEVRIRGDLRQEGTTASLRITIRDNGRGFDPAMVDGVFEPFLGSNPEHDTGLRLSIARSLARLVGGELTLEETGASGSTFCLTLPHHPAP